MSKIKIFTDSTADLSKELLERYNIGVVPLYVTIGEESYLDGVDITSVELYKKVDELQALPKTAAPSIADFAEAFRPWVDDGYDIIYIGISTKLSSTNQSALLAAQEFDEGRVRVIDSQNLSTGIGLLVLKAADLVEEGKGAEEIEKIINQLVPKVKVSFIIDTLKYLHMGGRCSSVQLLASNVLRIRPQIIVTDGGMIVGSKFRGKRKKCLNDFFNLIVGTGEQIAPGRVFVTHSESHEDAIDFKEKLNGMLNDVEVITTDAGSVISSHCGPGTIGILYIEQ